MRDSSKREKLIKEYKELLNKIRNSKTKEAEAEYRKLAREKYQEILVEQFDGDKNIGRFSAY